MSWNPLKIFSTNKPQRASNSDEDGLENYALKLERLESDARKLYKDSKKYEDCVLEMSKSENKMTEDLSNSLLCQEEEELRSLVEEWHSFARGLTKADEELVANLRYSLTDPVKRFHAVFPEVKFALRKYAQCQQDCEKLRAKVGRLGTKELTGNNLVRLDQAKHSLNSCLASERNTETILKKELPIFYDKRVEYFQPSIEALIRSEVEYLGNVTTVFNDTIIKVPKNYNPTSVDIKQRQRMEKIRALSIVVGS